MLIETGLMTFLLSKSGITSLVGQRIHYVQAPQDVAAPYLVLQKISGPRIESNDGNSKLASPRFQITAFAAKYGTAKTVIEAVRTALQGYQGMMGGQSGVYVHGAHLEDETDLDPGERSGLYGVSADYFIWHKES